MQKLWSKMEGRIASVRRLIYDLEVSPNLALVWKTGYNITVNYDSIVKERAIICIGWKWAGEKARHVLIWDKHQNDKSMLVEFVDVLSQADEAVAYFGDSFDLPWLRARALFHGIILPEVKSVDPLKWARKRYNFNSCKLDYVAKFLGAKGKLNTDYGLWKDVTLKNDPKALAKMAKYCSNDLILLEYVHDKLLEMTPQPTHKGVLEGGDRWSCPRCASDRVTHGRAMVSRLGVFTHHMQCLDCKKFFIISNTTYQKWLKRNK